ncbi:MAG: hypothetical protein MUE90_13070, partial [Thermoanaerobaculales bacterium]|nr:hypothetical protein [Thermoanaerobaculales bacterium]
MPHLQRPVPRRHDVLPPAALSGSAAHAGGLQVGQLLELGDEVRAAGRGRCLRRCRLLRSGLLGGEHLLLREGLLLCVLLLLVLLLGVRLGLLRLVLLGPAVGLPARDVVRHGGGGAGDDGGAGDPADQSGH